LRSSFPFGVSGHLPPSATYAAGHHVSREETAGQVRPANRSGSHARCFSLVDALKRCSRPPARLSQARLPLASNHRLGRTSGCSAKPAPSISPNSIRKAPDLHLMILPPPKTLRWPFFLKYLPKSPVPVHPPARLPVPVWIRQETFLAVMSFTLQIPTCDSAPPIIKSLRLPLPPTGFSSLSRDIYFAIAQTGPSDGHHFPPPAVLRHSASCRNVRPQTVVFRRPIMIQNSTPRSSSFRLLNQIPNSTPLPPISAHRLGNKPATPTLLFSTAPAGVKATSFQIIDSGCRGEMFFQFAGI